MEVRSRGLQNVGTNREVDKVFNPLFPPLKITGNGSISARSNAAVADIAETMANTSSAIGTPADHASITTYTETVANTSCAISTEIDRVYRATQPSSFRDSLSSQADLDFPNLAGETQQVSEDQAGFDDLEPNLAGETQPSGDQEGFDDMVVLQDDMVTLTSMPLTNGGFGALHERFQESNAQLQESLGTSAPYIPATAADSINIAGTQASSRDGADSMPKVFGTERPVPYPADVSPLKPDSVAAAEGPSEMLIVEEVHTVIEHFEVQRPQFPGQPGPGEASAEKRVSPAIELPAPVKDPQCPGKVVKPSSLVPFLGEEPAGPGEVAEPPAAESLMEDLLGPIQPAQLHGVEPSLAKEPDLGKYNAKDDRRTDKAEPEMQGDTTADAKLFTSTVISNAVVRTNGVPSNKPLEGTPIQSEGAPVNNDVNEQDVQAIKGRKVSKKFGRKSYQGNVVDYDSENKWFKVVYEDGDEEDLELAEVKEILLAPGSSPKTSSTKKKRPHPEGGADDEQNRNPKKRKDEQIEIHKKKGGGNRKRKGALRGKKSSGQVKKSSRKPKRVKSPGLKDKSSRKSIITTKPTGEATDIKNQEQQKKTDSETKSEEILDASAVKSPVSQAKRRGKRNRHSGTDASTSSKPGSSKNASKAKMLAKSSAKKKTGKAKTRRKSSSKKIAAKAQTPAKGSSKEKGTRRRRSLSKLSGEGRKNEKTPSKSRVRGSRTIGEEIEEPKRKRLKTDACQEHDVFVGKPIRKDFDSTLYNGVVVKFDKKTKYYKVKYEDGDQEDLELEELEAILA